MLPLPTCRDMSELATGYLEHSLPLRVRIGARWHLALCPACRRYYDQVRRTVRLLAAGRLPPPEAQAEARLLTRLRDGTPPPAG